jgi:hypothetical protein
MIFFQQYISFRILEEQIVGSESQGLEKYGVQSKHGEL